MKKNNDKNDTISVLRIDMNQFATALITELNPYKPTKFINYAWIPQTIGKQIFVIYEFETSKERLEYEEQLPKKFQKMLDRDLIQTLRGCNHI